MVAKNDDRLAPGARQQKAESNPIFSLDDKYTKTDGRVLITGTQALVRLALDQSRRDRAAGLHTAGFVTGYRGSPLGGVDQEFARARPFVEAQDVRFQLGLNEDLAATAVLGSQQINLLEKATRQGVFGMWYGKGPGVDRSGDAFRHGNLAGSSSHGGVVLLAGDDHVCKSSTTCHQSEYALMDAMIPTLNPSSIQDVLDFGLHAWALSRYSGCWTALKLVSDIVLSSTSVEVGDRDAGTSAPPDFELPQGGLGIRWPDTPQDQERRLHEHKIPAALAFARAYPFDRRLGESGRSRLGIVTTGKSFFDVLQALEELDISERRARELGIAIYKVGMVWPLEPHGIRRFAADVDELLVVEEKRPLLESQIKDILYSMPADRRPMVSGKKDAEGNPILTTHHELNSGLIAKAIGARILLRFDDEELTRKVKHVADIHSSPPPSTALQRSPYFCSGCPHSTSTNLPVGSRALAGIGCHSMALSMDRQTDTYTHMGAEGANWIGQSPFVPTKHVFQNLGDGTYFHSGLLAIRAAIAAKVNITYKILFNDAVAMTGGQRHDGVLSPQRITHQVRAEGVERIAVVSDNIAKYAGQEPFASDVTIHPRSELDKVQRNLREVSGVSILVYDQICAAEKRRRGKRVSAPVKERRVLINELVCEGCGDCSKASNCLSVTPIETEFGRKRKIDQSSCNTDFSCLNGFCPSFISIEGGKLRRSTKAELDSFAAIPLPEPGAADLSRPWNVLVTGIGGTGIVTIGAVLAVAAHIEGKAFSVLDMAGLAQKGGPVSSHLRFATRPDQLHAARISARSADVVLGGDAVVATGKEALEVVEAGRTRIVINSNEAITASFIRDPTFKFSASTLADLLRDRAGRDQVDVIAATKVAGEILGDDVGANLLMVGFACQRGLLPVSPNSIEAAIALNGVAIEMNGGAFRLGRLIAHGGLASVELLRPQVAFARDHLRLSVSPEEAIERRVRFLTEYQNARYGEIYREFVSSVQRRERTIGESHRLSDAVARSLFKLMAYKDEYEIARLYSGSSFQKQLAQTFEQVGTIAVYLAPPLLSSRDPATGLVRKRKFGRWIFGFFRLLARFRWLRGTIFDPFGHTAERRMERGLIRRYRASIERALEELAPGNYDRAVTLAAIAEDIGGYGHIKEKSVRAVAPRWERLEREMGLHPQEIPNAG